MIMGTTGLTALAGSAVLDPESVHVHLHHVPVVPQEHKLVHQVFQALMAEKGRFLLS